MTILELLLLALAAWGYGPMSEYEVRIVGEADYKGYTDAWSYVYGDDRPADDCLIILEDHLAVERWLGIITHEVGHCLGADHWAPGQEPDGDSIMFHGHRVTDWDFLRIFRARKDLPFVTHAPLLLR
jgi:predicted Zn-dependent protease